MALLKVAFESGAGLTLGPADRSQLIARAREMFASAEGGITFTLDGEELRFQEEAEAASSARRPAGHGDRVLTLEDAARLGENLLRSAAELSNQILDRAAQRGAEALDKIAEMQARQAALQAQQSETTLKQSAQVQNWIGGLTATVAEERLALAQIGTAERRLAEQKAIENAERDVQMARITAERDIHLARLNRPNTGAVLLDIAVAFATQFAQNAAHNFAEMNNNERES